MKFSLKELFLSITLASCGLAIVPVVIECAKLHISGILLLKVFFFAILFLPGALLGAAVGCLVHNLKRWALLGVLMEFVLVMVIIVYDALLTID